MLASGYSPVLPDKGRSTACASAAGHRAFSARSGERQAPGAGRNQNTSCPAASTWMGSATIISEQRDSPGRAEGRPPRTFVPIEMTKAMADGPKSGAPGSFITRSGRTAATTCDQQQARALRKPRWSRRAVATSRLDRTLYVKERAPDGAVIGGRVIPTMGFWGLE